MIRRWRWVLALSLTIAPAVHSQAAGCTPANEALIASAWRAYRADSAATALGRFTTAVRACPTNADARVGLGFSALRLGQLATADSAFSEVTRTSPAYADAWDGLALVRNRQGNTAGAIEAWKRVVALDPANTAAKANLDRVAPDWARAGPPLVKRRSPTLDVTMRVKGTQFELRTGDSWTPFYVKGVNMGLAMPGKFPSEFSTDSSLYARWFQQIGEMHANTLRIYTVLPPAFYRALLAYNKAHASAPLYVIHGVWTELPPGDDFDDPAFNAEYRQEIQDVIDLLHGAARIAPRPGHASGVYDADVSPWVIAYIMGREWEPYSAEIFNDKVGKNRSHKGRFVTIEDATPIDVWMVEQCDILMAYEFDTYNAQRPIAYTNWPTTDPILHTTETSYEQQMMFRGLKYDRDTSAGPPHEEEGVSLDASLAKPTAANVAGWFASYHVYPYYPDFMLYDPGYNTGQSSFGRSNYYGYLKDLLRHHAGIPVIISEFGIPSSRGNAHLQPQGWHHGGLSEQEAAVANTRLAAEIKEVGAAGAVVFAWIDEWFKRNWFTMDFEQPGERGRLWHNILSPEQHYGLVALRPGAPGTTPELGGDAARWRALPVLQRGTLIGKDSSLIRVGNDEGFVYVAIETPRRAGKPLPWDSLHIQLAFDTYKSDLGQFVLPTSGLRTGAGFEFLAEFHSATDAHLQVIPEYNPYVPHRLVEGGINFGEHFRRPIWVGRRFDAVFDTLFALTNRPRFTGEGKLIRGQGLNLGRLTYGRSAENSIADWFYDEASGMLQLRLPWLLLNVSDPSSRQVLFESDLPRALDPKEGEPESRLTGVPTDGFRIAAVALFPGPDLAGTIPALDPYGNWLLASFNTWTWKTWEEPTWHEYRKPAYYAFQRLWGSQ
jgi:tetratricopeptide (TPR) repeat protein